MKPGSDADLAGLLERARRRGFVARLTGDGDVRVRGVRVDSRLVEPGDLFVAVPGTRVDGAAFVREAKARGAVALACDAAHADAVVPCIVTDDPAAAAGYLASAFDGDPSDDLDLVGITGTNGKTSCTYLLESVLEAAGREPGVIGTIVQRCRAFERTSAMTTPSAVDLQALLAEMREAGVDAVAMEVSSHALDQRRVAGCLFRAALFTNLTRDHLDYHDSEDSYFAAKASLFRRWLDPVRGAAVLNADDARVRTLPAELGAFDVWTFSTEGQPGARARVVSAECTLAGIGAVFDVGGATVVVRSPLVGAANLSNLLAVATLARALGLDAEAIGEGLSACAPVPGRMERVSAAGQPAVFVDYAHTPDALERSLRALAAETRGRIVVVFGCGGDRDRGKRPIMGRLAAEHAQVVVLTSDNPRSEEPDAILAEIEAGLVAAFDDSPDPTSGAGPGADRGASRVVRGMSRCSAAELAGPDSGGYLVEVDRLLAIQTAIAIAGDDDVVLVAGKGHENYQEIHGVRRAFDDRKVCRAALLQRGNRA